MKAGKEPVYTGTIARRLRRTETEAEKILWTQLRNRNLIGAKFRRQHPIGRYIADFYCHEAHLVIELEGSIHDVPAQREYDAVRTKTLKEAGLRILKFANCQVLETLPIVLETISEALNTPQPQSLSLGERDDPDRDRGQGEGPRC